MCNYVTTSSRNRKSIKQATTAWTTADPTVQKIEDPKVMGPALWFKKQNDFS